VKISRAVLKSCIILFIFIFSLQGADLSTSLGLLKAKLLSLATSLNPVEKKYNNYQDFIQNKIKEIDPDIFYICRGCSCVEAKGRKKESHHEEVYNYIKWQQYPEFIEKTVKKNNKKLAMILIDSGFSESSSSIDQGLPEGLWKDEEEKKQWVEEETGIDYFRYYKNKNIHVFVLGIDSGGDVDFFIAHNVVAPAIKKEDKKADKLVIMGDFYLGDWGRDDVYYLLHDNNKALNDKRIVFYNRFKIFESKDNDNFSDVLFEDPDLTIHGKIENIAPGILLFVIEPGVNQKSSSILNFEEKRKRLEKLKEAIKNLKSIREEGSGFYEKTVSWLQGKKASETRTLFMAATNSLLGKDILCGHDYFKEKFQGFDYKKYSDSYFQDIYMYYNKENNFYGVTFLDGSVFQYPDNSLRFFQKIAHQVLFYNCLVLCAVQDKKDIFFNQIFSHELNKKYGSQGKFFAGTYDEVKDLFEKDKIKFVDKDGYKIIN